MDQKRLAAIVVAATIVVAASVGMTQCQLFVRLTDCQIDTDCTNGRTCNRDRHLCEVPPVELCNGTDDDHDGIADIDDDFGPCRIPAGAGQRICRDGVLRCRDNSHVTCEARQSPEPAEVCDNGQDDDCNGIVDDGPDCAQNFTATTNLQIGSNDPDEGEGDDAPAHQVCLAPFTIDRHEVTMTAFAVYLSSLDQSNVHVGRPSTPLNPTVVYGQYVNLDEAGQSIPLLAVPNEVGPLTFDRLGYAWAPHDATSGNLPVVNVTWLGASRYCEWAGKHLPTEAEFFRVARGPTGTRPYPWGVESPTCDRTNVGRGGPDGGPCVGSPLPVDQLQSGATAEGVFNIYGNVNEWMYDYLNTNSTHTRNNYYQSLSADGGAWCTTYPQGPIGPEAGAPINQPEDAGAYCVNCRFARGRHYRTVDLRIGIRRWLDADRGEPYVGFRCSQGGADRP